MGGGAAAADVVAAPVPAAAVSSSSGGRAYGVGAGVPTRLDVVGAGSGQEAGAGANQWRAMGGGGPAGERGSKAAKHAGGAGAQRARSERRVSFAQTVEVWEVEGNTALERAAARAKSELAQAAARHEVAAAAGAGPTDRADAAPRGSAAARAKDGGRDWSAAERSVLDSLADESRPPSPQPQVGAAHGARHERRTAAGSTKRDGRPTERDGATGAPRHAPRGAAWAEVLVVFAGEGGVRDLPACLRARGLGVTVVDTKQGGARHDVLRGEVGDALLRRVRRREFDQVFIATPCASYSVAHRPQLRTRRQPDGLANAPPEWRAYLAKHNGLARWTAELIATAHKAGAAWALENPADRGDRQSPAWWEKYADHAPIWLNEHIAAALGTTGAVKRTFAQCSFGAPWQKYTTIAHSVELREAMEPLDAMSCTHGDVPHEQLAHGRDNEGRSRAAQAAAYPPRMNEFIAEAMAEALRRGRDVGAPRHKSRGQSGGHVTDGPGLFGLVAEACEDARHTAPRFASLRNKRAAEASALALEALPGDLHAPIAPSKPPGRRAPREDGVEAKGGTTERARRASLRVARMALGPVPIAELFDGDLYEREVLPWMQRADAAGAALREGRQPEAVPTVTISQEQMAVFARDVVWDCSVPADCRPVERSTRRTVFPGRRQIDRAALRRVASQLAWHDTDIVGQAGEGGVEVRSDCALETVLAFHHTGVAANFAAAAKVVDADIGEEWVAPPVRHLPFVPCRMLPRNVVMQERVRWRDDGKGGKVLEQYLKPRITQNSSYGDEASVNAGVSDDERAIALPTVQEHGRASAICDTAGELGGARAERYVVDAESAYRFCPVQHADLWTQCFCWWGADGAAGVAVDRRLGFGGAYAPNRFERVSTLCAAYVQRLQGDFDDAQPPPAHARRWSQARAAAQQRGELPEGHAQLQPRHLQVYIDDFCGTALNDPVTPPLEVRGVTIDPINTSATGGTPAAPGSRVHVHAQLTVVGLATLGLSAAPSKVVVGDPTIGLGFELSRDERRLGGGCIRCPALKRAALLRAMAKHAEEARGGRVERGDAETTVGRLCNMAQAFPELKAALHGGYAVTKATWHVGGRRRRPPKLELRAGSDTARNWLELLELAGVLLGSNEGVPLAPERSFPPRTAPGALTVITDASGKDGVGGYAFDASDPGHIVLVAETWAPDVQAALDRAAAGGSTEPGLSMPSAETFGQWAVAAAAARALGRRPSVVTAVGDCAPAAGAINAASSGNAQMRRLVQGGRDLCEQWLAVAIPREWNLDADRLSHPSNLPTLRAEAEASGLRVTVAEIPSECWQALHEAIAAGVAPASKPKRARRARGKPPVAAGMAATGASP